MSEQINFLSPNEYKLIDYPGYAQNIDKVIKTLSGITNISQAINGEKKRLDLRFSTTNPFRNPTYGDVALDDGILLSIKVLRSKNNPSRPPKVKVQILGHVIKKLVFTNLNDLEYAPLEKIKDANNEEKLTNILPLVMPKSIGDTLCHTNNVPIFTMPTNFHHTDAVYSGIYRNDSQYDGQKYKILCTSYKNNQDFRDMVVFNMTDNFPTQPESRNVKIMRVKHVSDEQFQRVKKLFDMCPIWSRIALKYESGVSREKIKCITPFLAFYFSSGPWRTFFCRYGYDPRKDFNSRKYQTFDFRLRYRSGIAAFVSNRKDTVKKKQEHPHELSDLVEDIDYPYYEEKKLPRSRQCILRYCDLHIPKVTEMLENYPPPRSETTCNEKTGWLSVSFDEQVRQIVLSSITKLLRNQNQKEDIDAEVEPIDINEQIPGYDGSSSEDNNEDNNSDSDENMEISFEEKMT